MNLPKHENSFENGKNQQDQFEDGFYHDEPFNHADHTPTDLNHPTYPPRIDSTDADLDLDFVYTPPPPLPPARKTKARERHERRRGTGGQTPSGGQIPSPTSSPSNLSFDPHGDTDTDRLGDTRPMSMTSTVETPHATPRVRTERISRTRQQAVHRTRLQQVVPSGVARAPAFVQVLERLPISYMRLVAYALGALVLVIGVIFGLNLFKDDTPISEPNAIWLGTEWTYEDQGESAIFTLAQRLRDHKIGTVYAWVTWYTPSGTWGGSSDGTRPFAEREASVIAFVDQLRAAYPEVMLYAWLGVPVEGTGIPYRLNDTVLHDNLAQFSLRAITELGFDGVFLNVEPVWNNGQDDFIKLINRVRLEIGDNAPIAVAIPPDWTPVGVNIPQPQQVTPGTVWEKPFKQRVALLTDQMAIMAYNSGLRSPFDYIEWMAYQVQVYAEAVNEVSSNTQVIIGIPTYDNELPGHDVQVENVSSAVNGIKKGLVSAGNAAQVVAGVAIYAGWTTDETEWTQFRQGWVNR